jgi:arylsulfatase A
MRLKYSQRIFLYFTGLLLLASNACNTGFNKQNKSSKEVIKPNIIFIMADDMGYGDLGCYGQKYIQTPNIDRLASEGILFTQHYAGNTVCAPSRCSLMTGLHMGHAEIRGNKQVDPAGQWPISSKAITVAALLKQAGYTTAMIGKWGLGIEHTSGNPLKQGFDYYYGYLDQVLAHNCYPEYLLRNGSKEYLNNEVKYLDSTEWHKGLGSYSTGKVEYSNKLFTSDALQYIEKSKDTTFFLYLPYTIPHDNGEAPDEKRQEVPDYGIYVEKDWPEEEKGYAAMVTYLDDYVGQIMGKLKECGIDGNTVIFFTSDNGPMPDEEFTEFFNSNEMFRGGKRDLYEGGIRVPLIVRWPGKIVAGSKTKHMSAFWDFLPTACSLAGISPPANIDGISFLPALHQQNQKQHEYLYWEFTEKGGKQAIRKGNWKAVRNHVFDDPESIVELYDLSKDPGEQNNLASQYPEIEAEMDQLMKNARTESEVFPLTKKSE